MKRLALPLACLALVAAAGSAQAVNLVPGALVLTTGTAFSGAPFAGSTLVASASDPVTGMNALSQVRFTGELTTYVYREAGGTLDFFYQYANDKNSVDAVERLSVTNFSGFTTDVGYLTDEGGSQAPTFADRGLDGAKVSFDFTPSPLGAGTVAPGASNLWVYIRTDAKFYTRGTTSIIDGAVSTVNTFAPAVPEPASMLALGVGLVGIIRRRRANKN